MRSFEKYIDELLAIVNANNIIGKYNDVKAKEHRVNLLNYDIVRAGYSHYNEGVPYNLGDELGKVVIDWMLARHDNRLSRNMWVKGKKFFLSIGSGLLHSYQDVTFWGTGVERNYPPQRLFFHRSFMRKLDIRAVRGPLSREVVLKLGHKCPEVYGDPAILMPFIYHPKTEVTYEYAIIPQYITEKEIREEYPNDFIISMNTNDYESVITKIVSCKKVITSSLHGIILAEAYGVPAIWYRGLKKEVDFKYLDYYASTGRKPEIIPTSIEEAMVLEPLPLPYLKPLQEGLIKTFPYDLWEQ